MPHRIAERLRQLAIKCAQLSDSCTDKSASNELEGVSAELAQKAQKLDDLFKAIDKASNATSDGGPSH
jgi:hypothetical protein